MACRRALLGYYLFRQNKSGDWNACPLHLSKIIFRHRIIERHFHKQRALLKRCDFGFLFDIDGVIVRGRKPLPFAKEAFSLLTENKKFKIPTLFVTNAGNSLRSRKAQQLSEWLEVEVSEEQVVLSHSPLKMFRQFHDKHVLVSGQGPIAEIAANIGFKRVTTVEQLAQHYPELDKMDHSRRKAAPCAFEEYYPRIDAIILFGEPVRWETPLQLIMDVLLTNGKPSDDFFGTPYPHIPILACNTDLLWMSEFKVPR
ncbi:cat eye syndrome critical region protein 5 [Elysia marginata]|uniref:Cat eye syndrome critical region protein 5 n=1 Tax=Elysia marginata TaxID=1093978 RepID=A0AAV4GV25_9GAST|nr:cat eye syndrome critical region protein 5 [Elysia marginata]